MTDQEFKAWLDSFVDVLERRDNGSSYRIGIRRGANATWEKCFELKAKEIAELKEKLDVAVEALELMQYESSEVAVALEKIKETK